MLNNSFTLAVWRLPAADAAAASAANAAAASASATTPEAADLTISQRKAMCATMQSWGASHAGAAAASTSAAAASYSAELDQDTLIEMSVPDLEEEDAYMTPRSEAAFWAKVGERRRETREVKEKAMQEVVITGDSDAVLMAYTQTRFRVYSIDRSPDGRFVAVGEPGLGIFHAIQHILLVLNDFLPYNAMAVLSTCDALFLLYSHVSLAVGHN